MEHVWLLSGIATAIIIVLALIGLLRKKPEEDDQIIEPREEPEETEPEIKRGVVVEKNCFVDKTGAYIPNGAELSRVCFSLKIRTTDGKEEDYLVGEEDYTAAVEGQPVTYMKQGKMFLGFGVDVEEE